MATTVAMERAGAQQRSMQRVVRTGRARGRRIGADIRSRAEAALEGFGTPEAVAGAATEGLEAQFVEAFTEIAVEGHLQGRADGVRQAAAAARAAGRGGRSLNTLTDSIRFLEARLELAPGRAALIGRLYEGKTLEIARGLAGNVQRAVGREVASSLAAGDTLREGKARLRGVMDRLGVPSADTPGHLLETTWRTQTQLGYSAGSWNLDQEDEVAEILWGYEYVTVGDGRVRPTHAGLDGTRLPKDHAFWLTSRPPNGFNCRCVVIRIFDTDSHVIVEVKETARVKLQSGKSVIVEPKPDQGWDFNPGRQFRDVEAFRASHEIPANPRFRVLLAIAALGEPHLAAIAADVGRAKSTITEHVSGLVEAGLVEHGQGDVGCRLTKAGRQCAAHLRRSME